MILETFPVGPFQCNCSILADPQSGTAIIVDPGADADVICKMIKAKGYSVKYLVHTHAHLDHIGATRAVHSSCGGAICLHRDDLPLYDNIAMQGEFMGIQVDPVVTPVTQYIGQQDTIEADALRLEVLHTPGHTPGSVCFNLKNFFQQGRNMNILFSGDTLFSGSIGRTDLWGGDYNQIIASIHERLMKLSPDTIVIPGHGPNTSIAREKSANPFLQE